MVAETKKRFQNVIDTEFGEFDWTYISATFLDPNTHYFVDGEPLIDSVIGHILVLATVHKKSIK